MIEVLFGESEAGSMRIAKSNIPGNSDEVICLGFMLDVGDIKQEVSSKYRKNLIFSLLYQEQRRKDEALRKRLIETGNVYLKELERLKTYIENGEKIRVWYSKSPYSICGLYFLCNWMKQYNNEMYWVELPKYRINKSSITSYQNWGEVSPKEFSSFLNYQKKLSKNEQNMYVRNWLELVEDNSPLRVMINNQVVGVKDDFYDFLIWKKLSEKPITQSRLIGTIIGNYQLSVGDWWYAKRIQYYIDSGLIEVVKDSDNKYARLIKKA